MRRCGQCGGRLQRIHRTLVERLEYMALFECRECKTIIPSPRRWMLHLGPACRCPICGTYRVTRLKTPDRIDKHLTGVLNIVERLVGGKRFHCRYCRVQFFDRRPLRAEVPHVTEPDVRESFAATNRPDTASSGE